MGRQILVNGEVVPVAQDTITAGRLKEQLRLPQDMWVMANNGTGIVHVSDHEVISMETQTVSIVPGYDYGRAR